MSRKLALVAAVGVAAVMANTTIEIDTNDIAEFCVNNSDDCICESFVDGELDYADVSKCGASEELVKFCVEGEDHNELCAAFYEHDEDFRTAYDEAVGNNEEDDDNEEEDDSNVCIPNDNNVVSTLSYKGYKGGKGFQGVKGQSGFKGGKGYQGTKGGVKGGKGYFSGKGYQGVKGGKGQGYVKGGFKGGKGQYTQQQQTTQQLQSQLQGQGQSQYIENQSQSQLQGQDLQGTNPQSIMSWKGKGGKGYQQSGLKGGFKGQQQSQQQLQSQLQGQVQNLGIQNQF